MCIVVVTQSGQGDSVPKTASDPSAGTLHGKLPVVKREF